YLVNKACKSIAIRTEKAMPKFDPARINAELGVTTSPLELPPGKLSKAKNKQNATVNVPASSLAQMVVVSKMHPAGISKRTGRPNFNMRTGSVFQLSKPNTHG